MATRYDLERESTIKRLDFNMDSTDPNYESELRRIAQESANEDDEIIAFMKYVDENHPDISSALGSQNSYTREIRIVLNAIKEKHNISVGFIPGVTEEVPSAITPEEKMESRTKAIMEEIERMNLEPIKGLRRKWSKRDIDFIKGSISDKEITKKSIRDYWMEFREKKVTNLTKEQELLVAEGITGTPLRSYASFRSKFYREGKKLKVQ